MSCCGPHPPLTNIDILSNSPSCTYRVTLGKRNMLKEFCLTYVVHQVSDGCMFTAMISFGVIYHPLQSIKLTCIKLLSAAGPNTSQCLNKMIILESVKVNGHSPNVVRSAAKCSYTKQYICKCHIIYRGPSLSAQLQMTKSDSD